MTAECHLASVLVSDIVHYEIMSWITDSLEQDSNTTGDNLFHEYKISAAETSFSWSQPLTSNFHF